MSKKKKVTTLSIREQRLKENGIKPEKKGETTFMNHFNDIFKRK
jgi:hypothetical protein|tara:strand:+ start:199 stop:330 length:132 start_codon:yes stop_codon:yes gene_type:complete